MESMLRIGDWVYTGTLHGQLLRVYLPAANTPTSGQFGTTQVVGWFNDSALCQAQAGKAYEASDMTLIGSCGRLLGLAADAPGSLLVVEAASGLWRARLSTSTDDEGPSRGGDLSAPPSLEWEPLLTALGPGEPHAEFWDDVAFDRETGDAFFTVFSTRFPIQLVAHDTLSCNASGLFGVYNVHTHQSRVLARRVMQANGVTLSPWDRNNVYFVAGPRVWKYDRRTDEASVFLDNLPAIPDNIRPRHFGQPGRFLVGAATRRTQPFALLDTLGAWPMLRNVLGALVPRRVMVRMVPVQGLVLEVELENHGGEPDWSPSITNYWQDLGGRQVRYVSEAHDDPETGSVLIGSWHEQCVWSLPADRLTAD